MTTSHWTEIRVETWTQLVEVLHSPPLVDQRREEGDHYRSPFIFRGVQDAGWELATSFQRLDTSGSRAGIERALLRSFRKYARSGTFDGASDWYVLAVAQHNGLPTRCLDWTSAPLVATHFATSTNDHAAADAAIWCLDTRAVRDHLSAPPVRAAIHSQYAWLFDTRMLESAFATLWDFDKVHPPSEHSLVIWEPPSIDGRIQNQNGLFTVASDPEVSQHKLLASLAEKVPDAVFKITIAASAKPMIRDMLDLNNFTERMLFPGLPGLCDWLKRRYSRAW